MTAAVQVASPAIRGRQSIGGAAVILLGGFSPEKQAGLAVLVRVLLLQPVFFGVAEVLTRFLNAHHHYTYPAVAPALYNHSIIAGAVLLGPRLGTLGLAIGVTAGALV